VRGGSTALVGAPRRDTVASDSARTIRVAQVVTKLTAGAGVIALRGALALDPERYSTTILAAEGGSLAGRAEAAGIEVVPLRHMARGRGVYPWADAHGLRELMSHLAAGDFDLVHTHSAKAGALGRIAARRVGVPAIVHTFHGFPFHDFQAAPVRRGLVAIERGLGRITDFFFAAGTVVAADAVRLRIAAPHRIRALATVPLDDALRPVTAATRAHARDLLGIPAAAKVVGTVARLDAQKSPLDMVEAIAALRRRDVYMVWIGDGDLRAKTELLVARKGLRDRFKLVGDRTDVPAVLPAFDVFAMSSLYEGLPCAVVEAMACGVPVVATAVNSVPELVIAGKTGIVARAGDPASLSGALAYMLDHPRDAARMAEAGNRHVRDRFRPELLGRDVMDGYELALSFARARPTSSSIAELA
jgi:glycosyltransferase involved in cell wall biosynthesis